MKGQDGQVYKRIMYLFLEVSVTFLLLRNKPPSSQGNVSMPAFYFESFIPEQGGVSMITLEQHTCSTWAYRAKRGPVWARKHLSSKKCRHQILAREEILPTSLLNVFIIVCLV